MEFEVSLQQEKTMATSALAKGKQRPPKKELNRGPWTAEEDRKLAGAIEINGPKQWTTIAAKAGLISRNINGYS